MPDKAERNGPIGGAIRSLAVDPSTPSVVYAGTEQGVMKSTVITGFVIDRTTPSTLYVGTGNGVFKSIDAGTTWTHSGPSRFIVHSLAGDPSNPRILYAAEWGRDRNRDAEDVFRTTDAGQTWTSFDTGLPPGGAGHLAVAQTDPPTLYLGLDGYGVFKRASKRWIRTASASEKYDRGIDVGNLAVDPRSPSTFYMGSIWGGLSKSTNAGGSWVQVNKGVGRSIPGRNLDVLGEVRDGGLAIDPTAPSTLYVGTRSGVFKSTDGATTWAATTLTNSKLLPCSQCASWGPLQYLFLPIAIDPNNPSTVYAGPGRGYGDGKDLQGSVFKTTDGGANWVRQISFVGNVASAVSIDPQRPGVLYAGTQGGVFVSSDDGINWLYSGLGDVEVNALVADPAAPGTIYVGSRDRGVFKSTDSGATWRAADEGLTEPNVVCLTIDPSHPGSIYAGTTSGLFKSTNGGDHWSLVHATSAVNRVEIDPRNASAVYLGLADGVLVSADGGNTWSKGGLKSGATALAAGARGILYAGTEHGVFRSTDDGATWNPANAGIDRAWVYALLVDPDASNTVYAGTVGMFDTGGVLKSTNSGATWKRLADGSVRALALGTARPKTLYAATITDGVIVLRETAPFPRSGPEATHSSGLR